MTSPMIVFVLAPVSIQSLLPQMLDLDRLMIAPNPRYKTEQASSYDRASKSPTEDWFANGDAGKFLRTERREGRAEYVMADLRGPGAVVRIWSANPAGVIRFYFDGEAGPRLEAKMADLLTGKVPPFEAPFAYGAAQGTNLYFPIPYSRGLKITVDNSDNDRARALYYHVGYRSYPAGTPVESFSMAALRAAAGTIGAVGSRLTGPLDRRPGEQGIGGKGMIKPGAEWQIEPIKGPGVIRSFAFRIPFPLVQTLKEMTWEDPHQPHNVVRSLWLSVNVDGETTIEAPLSDFFAAAPDLRPYKSLPMEVREDGTMICRFPMPLRREMRVTLRNRGAVEVPVQFDAAIDRTIRPTASTYLFRARFGREFGRTRPMRDLTFLSARGEGKFVGVHLHIENPTPAWWGEGDEKIYVDGEAFPSTFGTGTEDYFGYAWCSPILFERPYHGQPRCDGPGNFGHTSVFRWHVLDPIPFRTSLKFDMEMWHWADVEAGWNWTAYWYARPGALHAAMKTPPVSELLPKKLSPPEPVKGATEGESLTEISKTGGTTSHQEGFWELSAGKQLWWVDAKVGDRLVLAGRLAEAGNYSLKGNFCHARDYGIHQLYLNGKPLGKPIDFFGDGVTWKLIDFGSFQMPAGEFRLEVECVGINEKAIPRGMFGLDYLLFRKL